MDIYDIIRAGHRKETAIMHTGNKGNGLSKHYGAGNNPRSPRYKHTKQREANAEEEDLRRKKSKQREIQNPASSVSELFSRRK